MNEQGIWLILPLVIPLMTAIACMFGISLRPGTRWLQRWISTVGTLLQLMVTLILFYVVWREGIQVVQVGSWPMPFGITLVADLFSGIMLVMTGIIGATVQVYALASMDAKREALGFYPLYNVLLLGVSGAFLTGDIFNLYVWFEVMLMSSFVLMGLGNNRGQIEGALKYVALNLVASAIFLSAIGVLYGVIGSLNMADLSVKFAQLAETQQYTGLVNVIAALFLVAFGIKAAVFPLFFWLPDSYYAPPVAVSAVFAGLLTKVGVYSMIRVFTLIFPLDQGMLQGVLLWVAGLTMFTGVLGAVAQTEVRRLLSFHIISQIGYMVMGLALFTPLAIGGAVFYIFHNVMAKTNLFLIGGILERVGGSGDLKKLGSFYQNMPVLSVLFLISAMSLAGVPPLSGFFAKLSLVQAGLAVNQVWLVAVALLVSLLTLYSMNKIWMLAFWKPIEEVPEDKLPGMVVNPEKMRWGAWLTPVFALAAITLVLGIGSGLFFPIVLQAGQEILDPSIYINAVFRSGE